MANDSDAPPSGQGQASPGFGGAQMADLVGMLGAAAQNGGDPSRILDAISQTLVMVLGSGPAFATLDSLIAANQANGLMYHNAVAHQQKTNIFGMCATMKCVSALLDKPMAGMVIDDDEEAV